MGPQSVPASTDVSAVSTMTTLSTADSIPPVSIGEDDEKVVALWRNLEKGHVPHLLDQDLAERELKDVKEARINALIETGRQIPVSLPRKTIDPRKGIQRLPDEILILICNQLETTEILLFGHAWHWLARITTKYDLVHIRDMKCFVFRTDFRESILGIGIEIDFSEGKQGFIQSEFDLLSEEGYNTHGVRRSVQGVPFEHWLPLPISEER